MKNRILALMHKEFIHISRDPRSLTVAILIPIMMLILFGSAITFEVKHFPVAVFDQDQSFLSREFVRQLTSSEYLQLTGYIKQADEIQKLLDGEIVGAVINLPAGFEKKLKRLEKTPVQILLNGSDANLASIAAGYLSGFLESFSQKIITEILPVSAPLQAKIRVWYNPELKSTYFFVPGLIGVILMMLSAVLTAMTIVGEKEKGTFEQLIASPVKPAELMIGKLTPYILIAFFDVLLITTLGRLIFGVPIRGNLILLFAIAAIFLICALGIGLFISSVARTQQEAMMLALIGTMLPSILLSGFIFPIASMPKAVQLITYLIPARYFLIVVRSIFLKGTGLLYFWPEVLMLTIFAVLIISASARRFKKKLES